MKKIFPIIILILLANCSGIFKSKPEYLYVQTAKTGSFDGKDLKLYGTSKNTIMFSDRPYRIAGHIKNQDFVKMWNSPKQQDSFRKDPPNAAISYYDKDGKPDIAIIEISNLKTGKNSLNYQAKILEGKLPKQTSEVTLFIDGCVDSPTDIYDADLAETGTTFNDCSSFGSNQN